MKGSKLMFKLMIPVLATLVLGCASVGPMESAGPPKPKKCSVSEVGASRGVSSELGLAAVLLGAVVARRARSRRRDG